MMKMPMVQAWAYYAWAVENDPFGNAERGCEGYIRQEILKRLKKEQK
jgi:hypothetical protein